MLTLQPVEPDPSHACETHSHPPTPGMIRAYRQLLDEVEAPSLIEQDRSWLDRVVAFFSFGECVAAVGLCLVLIGCATETRSNDDTRNNPFTEQG